MLSRELNIFFLHNTKDSQNNKLVLLSIILKNTYIIVLLQQKLLKFLYILLYHCVLQTINLKHTDVEYIIVEDYKEEALSKSEYFNDRLKSEYVNKFNKI